MMPAIYSKPMVHAQSAARTDKHSSSKLIAEPVIPTYRKREQAALVGHISVQSQG